MIKQQKVKFDKYKTRNPNDQNDFEFRALEIWDCLGFRA